jgi:hypothetical protein
MYAPFIIGCFVFANTFLTCTDYFGWRQGARSDTEMIAVVLLGLMGLVLLSLLPRRGR